MVREVSRDGMEEREMGVRKEAVAVVSGGGSGGEE